MHAAPDVKIWVEAHIDKQRDPRAARRISQRAADAVIEALLSRGVARERLEPVGWGDSKPIYRNTTAAERATNRRVEFGLRVCGPGPSSHECR